MTYDCIIQNPPYSKSLHLDFLNLGLDNLASNGRMVIIEPATWLINIRRNGKAGKYDAIKRRIEGHVESVVVENLNFEFGTVLHMPFATTTIDMGNTYEKIDFACCGEHKQVSSVYDCNLIGDYQLVQSILDKCKLFGDMVKSHVTDKALEGDWCYAAYKTHLGSNTIGCGATTKKVGMSYDGKSGLWGSCAFGEYAKGYFISLYHLFNNEISDKPHCAYDKGKHLTDKVTNNVYGTRTEMENWKHFVFNNKLPLFLNLCLTDAQDCTSHEHVPWLVDRQYTDEEINRLFGFTADEVKLIDATILKFNRQSPWFRRYMCGRDSVSDDEVSEFMKKISI